MRVLVTWGSERGGTAEIGRILAGALQRADLEVAALPADEVGSIEPYDAVVIGGALYANRWHRDARRFVRRHVAALRRVPVWCFSSGPLDDSADHGELATPREVAALMARIGAIGHVTFGGRLRPDAPGLMARAMAKQHAGDWRNPARIRQWADELAHRLPWARPVPAVESEAGRWSRLVGYGLGAGVAAAGARLALALVPWPAVAISLHAIVLALIVGALARGYARPGGARGPAVAAAGFAAPVAALDAVAVALGAIDATPAVVVGLTAAVSFAVVLAVGWFALMIPPRAAPGPVR